MAAVETDAASSAIRVRSLSRRFNWDGGSVTALTNIDLDIEAGEAVALMGPSGSGKTTLLNLIGGLDRPTSGSIITLGNKLDQMSESQLTAFRARSVGIVFQDPHLLPGFTALDNVVLSRLPWRPIDGLRAEAQSLLIEVGLGDRLKHASGRLSGGERQRVGIARALVGAPALLLADEPTGNLDISTTAAIVTLLRQLRRAHQLTILVATHDPEVASLADRVVRLSGGSISSHGGEFRRMS
jgi:putative ABC transport system ATP-binding protein